jgi:hypothetical protein
MTIAIKHPSEYSEAEKAAIAANAEAIILRSVGQTVPLEDVQKIVQHLAIQRAAEMSKVAAKPVKAVRVAKTKPITKASLLADLQAGKTAENGEAPALPDKPKRAPTKAAKMKLYFRKSQGETLTELEEAILATLTNP